MLRCLDLFGKHLFYRRRVRARDVAAYLFPWVGPARPGVGDEQADLDLRRSAPNEFSRAEAAAKVGFHGAFGFPIKVGAEVEGIIELYSREIEEPDEELLKMVTDVGSKIGQFGERARAEEALGGPKASSNSRKRWKRWAGLQGVWLMSFNNMLTVIRGYSELVLSRLAPGDALRKNWKRSKRRRIGRRA